MSKKLSSEESLESLNAINEYKKDNPGAKNKKVVVKKGTEKIFDGEISVIAGNYNTYFKIDIMWEDVPHFEFKNKGLYGSYSSTYNKITYNNGMMPGSKGDLFSTLKI